MTFIEWCNQTARDADINVTQDLVKAVMITALRTAIEEFVANPADASLDIYGIGRFYLNRSQYDMSKRFHLKDRTEVNDIVGSWIVHFKPSIVLKEVLNGKRELKDMLIGSCIPLYTDKDIQADGTIKKKKGTRDKKQLVVKRTIVKDKRREQKKIIKAKLPED